MKNFPIIFFFFISIVSLSQVVDDFTDGNFTENPSWIGDTSRFEITSNFQLHLNSTGADTSSLWVQSNRVEETEWQVWVKLSFNTSSNNHARIYLVADSPNPGFPLNGYYLQIGGSNDSLSLVKQAGNIHQNIITGSLSFTGNSTNILRIKVVHDKDGIWHLLTDPTGNSGFRAEGTCMDTTYYLASWFGLYCKYTTSNATKFYFDDIYIGPVIIDSTAPAILSVEMLTTTELLVTFSEQIEETSAESVSNYVTRHHGEPISAELDSTNHQQVRLKLTLPFEDDTCDTLQISNVKDLAGNILSMEMRLVCFHRVMAFDIVINEIMADPDPSAGLPTSEFAELYNRTPYPINLFGWTFRAGNTVKTIPDRVIPPNGYLILSGGDQLQPFGEMIDLFTSSSTLTNEGSLLVLKNNQGQVIHSVSYSADWYNNSLKENGGWSLEMIDTGNPCGCSENWSASNDPLGGTPGGGNSITRYNPDTVPPRLQRANISSDSLVHLVFSEQMDSLSFGIAAGWKILPGEITVLDVNLVEPGYDEAVLYLQQKLASNNVYQAQLPNGLRDCSGNALDYTIEPGFAIPDTVSPFDMIINEILPNPFTGGERFIELYNRSQKIINLRDLVLIEYESLSTEGLDPVEITAENFLVFPGDFLVLTKDPEDIQSRYIMHQTEGIIRMSTLPSLSDEEGTVILSRKYDYLQIDKMTYSEEMQFPLLRSFEGVSLERIRTEGLSSDPLNWHSASENCGFATPGYTNSQFINPQKTRDLVTLDPEFFTPDNDGADDVMLIRFTFDKPGYMANIILFDDRGRMVRQLARNDLVSTEGIYSWDGTNENREKASIGIYLVYIELFDMSGRVVKIKKVCVIGGK